MMENIEFEIKANMGLILRGNLNDLDRLLTVIKNEIDESECQIVFREVSADRLWISKEDIQLGERQ